MFNFWINIKISSVFFISCLVSRLFKTKILKKKYLQIKLSKLNNFIYLESCTIRYSSFQNK